jgi:hypothetical protein
MAKVGVKINYDYVAGYLRYGHDEGILEIPDNELNTFLENPKKYIEENDLRDNLKFILDDYRIEDWGDIDNVEVYPIGENNEYD